MLLLCKELLLPLLRLKGEPGLELKGDMAYFAECGLPMLDDLDASASKRDFPAVFLLDSNCCSDPTSASLAARFDWAKRACADSGL